jgi:hypothetical protein
MKGEELSYNGLNDYEGQCIDANLDYFRLPFKKFKRMFDRTGKWEACKPESGIIFGLCA